jgi:cytoskeleton protein RodZ
MTDDADKEVAADSADAESKPVAGERLAEARRAKQISVVEIAKELHLDEPKVRALERNDFDALGAPVFAKGHLRKYAELVDVEFDDVIAEYYEFNREPPAPLVISSQAKPRRELSPGPWIVVIIVLIFATAAYWWFSARPPAAVTSLPAATEAPLDRASVAAEAVVPEPAAEQVDDVVSDDDVAEPVEEIAAAEESVLDDGLLELSVNYSGDCWTEISDAAGKRLYFGLGKDGRSITVSGEAPMNVLFGDAQNVTILVNGVPRAIAAAERRGKTARFTISQP